MQGIFQSVPQEWLSMTTDILAWGLVLIVGTWVGMRLPVSKRKLQAKRGIEPTPPGKSQMDRDFAEFQRRQAQESAPNYVGPGPTPGKRNRDDPDDEIIPRII